MKLRLFIVLMGTFLFLPSIIWAFKTMYITDRGADSIVLRPEIGSNRQSGIVKFGELVDIIEEDRGWSKTRTPNGVIGWIGSRSLSNEYQNNCHNELEKIKETHRELESKNISLTMENERLIKELEETIIAG